jgi:hypothetical protein
VVEIEKLELYMHDFFVIFKFATEVHTGLRKLCGADNGRVIDQRGQLIKSPRFVSEEFSHISHWKEEVFLHLDKVLIGLHVPLSWLVRFCKFRPVLDHKCGRIFVLKLVKLVV